MPTEEELREALWELEAAQLCKELLLLRARTKAHIDLKNALGLDFSVTPPATPPPAASALDAFINLEQWFAAGNNTNLAKGSIYGGKP